MWIDTKERLPAIDTWVLFVIEYEDGSFDMHTGYRFNEDTWTIGSSNVDHESVTAWMPLPEYKDQD